MAQEPHEPTEEKRQIVYALSADGVPQKRIAKEINVSNTTLHKYYGKELNTAAITKIRLISNILFQKALKGDTTCCIFFLKTQAQWRELREGETYDHEQAPQIHRIEVDVIRAEKKNDKL